MLINLIIFLCLAAAHMCIPQNGDECPISQRYCCRKLLQQQDPNAAWLMSHFGIDTRNLHGMVGSDCVRQNLGGSEVVCSINHFACCTGRSLDNDSVVTECKPKIP